MDENELDNWFVVTKQEITDKYFAELNKTQDFAKTRAKYEKMYRKLIDEYQKKQNKLIDHKEFKEKSHKPAEKITEFMDKLSGSFEEKT